MDCQANYTNEAEFLIYEFKKHLQDKWKKNKANQHINKIIHYHVQSTFFFKYACHLFLNIADQLHIEFSNSDSLIQKLKKIQNEYVLENKKVKSIEVIQMYFEKLTQNNLLDDFLLILAKVMLREECTDIPNDLQSQKIDLFYRISPIIAFLAIFWYKQEKKPSNLDELISKSGLKELLKNIKVGKSGSDSKKSSRKPTLVPEDDEEKVEEDYQDLSDSANQQISILKQIQCTKNQDGVKPQPELQQIQDDFDKFVIESESTKDKSNSTSNMSFVQGENVAHRIDLSPENLCSNYYEPSCNISGQDTQMTDENQNIN